MTSGNESQTPQYNPSATGQMFGNRLTTELNKPAPVFNKTLYPGIGSTTTNALSDMISGSNPSGYSDKVGGAIDFAGGLADGSAPSLTESTLMDVAQGRHFGTDDPGYALLRKNLMDDTLTATNNVFDSSGLFGSDSNRKEAGEGVANALAGLDYANFQNDIGRQERALSSIEGTRQQGINNAFTAQAALPALYDAALRPAATRLAAGQVQDADAAATRAGEADLFDRTNNADYNKLLELLSAFSGSQNNAGMREEVPLWQQILGYGAQLGGTALGTFARGGF